VVDEYEYSHLSITQGRPTSHAPADFDALSTTEMRNVPTALEASLPDIVVWKLRLAQLQHRLSHIFNGKETLASRLALLADLDLDMIRWRDSIPMECRPEHPMLVADNMRNAELYGLQLDYHNLVRALHWGAIVLTAGRNPKTLPQPRLRASESICVSACIALVETTNELSTFLKSPGTTRPDHSRRLVEVESTPSTIIR
jgi:hypothetical protein